MSSAPHKRYLKVPIDLIKSDSNLISDIFLHLARNEKMLKIANQFNEISSENISRYKSKNLKEVFIPHPEDDQKLLEIFRQNEQNPNPDIRSLFDIKTGKIIDSNAEIVLNPIVIGNPTLEATDPKDANNPTIDTSKVIRETGDLEIQKFDKTTEFDLIDRSLTSQETKKVGDLEQQKANSGTEVDLIDRSLSSKKTKEVGDLEAKDTKETKEVDVIDRSIATKETKEVGDLSSVKNKPAKEVDLIDRSTSAGETKEVGDLSVPNKKSARTFDSEETASPEEEETGVLAGIEASVEFEESNQTAIAHREASQTADGDISEDITFNRDGTLTSAVKKTRNSPSGQEIEEELEFGKKGALSKAKKIVKTKDKSVIEDEMVIDPESKAIKKVKKSTSAAGKIERRELNFSANGKPEMSTKTFKKGDEEIKEEIRFSADGKPESCIKVVKGPTGKESLEEIRFGADNTILSHKIVVKGGSGSKDKVEEEVVYGANGKPQKALRRLNQDTDDEKTEEVFFNPEGELTHSVIRSKSAVAGEEKEQRFSAHETPSKGESIIFKKSSLHKLIAETEKDIEEEKQAVSKINQTAGKMEKTISRALNKKGQTQEDDSKPPKKSSLRTTTDLEEKFKDHDFHKKPTDPSALAQVSSSISKLDDAIEEQKEVFIKAQSEGKPIENKANKEAFDPKSPIIKEYKNLQVIRETCLELIGSQEEFLNIFASDFNSIESQRDRLIEIFEEMESLFRSYTRFKEGKGLDAKIRGRYPRLPNILEQIDLSHNPVENLLLLSERVQLIKEDIAKMVTEVDEKRQKIKEIFQSLDERKEGSASFFVNTKDSQLCAYTIALGLGLGYTDPKFLRDMALITLIKQEDQEILDSPRLPNLTREIFRAFYEDQPPSSSVIEDATQIFKITRAYVKRPDCITGRLKLDPAVFESLSAELLKTDKSISPEIIERARQFAHRRGASRDIENICIDVYSRINHLMTQFNS